MTIENLITDNIDIWTAAIKKKSATGRGSSKKIELYGVKKLRELILELAVRGKLVAQDPNDEPASVLLERIAAEKAQLVKDKKIKKPKKMPQITEEEKPFNLPSGWEWKRFQDITSYIQRGKSPKYAENGSVRVVSQKCVQNSGFDLTPAKYVTDESLEKYQKERFLLHNDILWNSTGTGTVGRANVISGFKIGKIVADSHVTVIRPHKIYSRFLWCFIMAPGIQSRIEPDNENALVSGSTKQVELNTSSITSIVVPIAPEKEQHRIVAKVDELMALCDQLEQQTESSIDAHKTLVEVLLATLTESKNANDLNQNWARISEFFDTLFTTEHSIDQLKQTILQLAVMGKLVPQDPNDEPASKLLERIAAEKAQLIKDKKIKKQKALPPITEEEKPFELPDGWEWCRIQEITSKITDGDHKTPPRIPSGFPLLSAKNVRDGYLDTSNTDFIAENHYIKSRERCLPECGDLLIVSVGGTIGRSSLVPEGSNFALVRSVALIKPMIFSPLYLKYAMDSKLLQDSIHSNKRGGAQPCLYLSEISKFPFSMPPLPEQKRIVEKARDLIALCEKLKTCLRDSQTTQLHLTDAIVQQVV